MRTKAISLWISLPLTLSASVFLLIVNAVPANAECIPAAYPPVVCLNTSSGISPATVDTTVAAAVALFEATAPTPSGTTAKAVITIPVTTIDPVTGSQTSINVIQTITKEVSSSGLITISRTLTIGNTTMVLTGGSGSAVAASIPANSTVTAQGTGFQAGSYVDIYIYSKSIYLGSFKVDRTGDVLDTVKIPANLAIGNHSLVIAGKNSKGEKLIFPTPIVVGKALANSGKKIGDTVFFSSKSAVVDTSQRLKIKALIKRIPKTAKNLQVSIQGYSEKTGKNSQSATATSRVRASSVSKYLVALGIKSSSMSVKGLGWYKFKGKLGNRVEIQISWK